MMAITISFGNIPVNPGYGPDQVAQPMWRSRQENRPGIMRGVNMKGGVERIRVLLGGKSARGRRGWYGGGS